MSEPRPAERREAREVEVKALASTLRLRILRACLHEARTNKEIAAAVGREPGATLHHVRRLVDAGFLTALPARRGTRGSREIPYFASGKSWQISTPAAGQVMLNTFLEESALVPATEMDANRLGLRLSPDQMSEFRDRLQALLDEFAERPDDPSAPAFSLFIAIHPDPNRP